jgi:structural maintenance of chromosome 4
VSLSLALTFLNLYFKCQELDKTSSDINRHKVKITTCEKLIKKLTKGVEEAKKETENLIAQKEKLMSVFKETEKKAFLVQEDYKKNQEVVYVALWSGP